MGLPKAVKVVKEFQYDFALDGGATGAIALKSVDESGDLLPEGMIVTDIAAVVETTITSGGTPTLTLGTTTDVDGFFVDVFAVFATANAVIRAGQVDGALIWNTTTDSALGYRVPSTAADQNVLLTVGTAALTAGKFKVMVEGWIPSSRQRSENR